MDLNQIEADIKLAKERCGGQWIMSAEQLAEMVELIRRQEAELRQNLQALADSNLALMEQTEIAQAANRQAEEATAAERQRAVKLAMQWSNAREPDSGGNALRNYAHALAIGTEVDERPTDYHWSKAPQQHAQAVSQQGAGDSAGQQVAYMRVGSSIARAGDRVIVASAITPEIADLIVAALAQHPTSAAPDCKVEEFSSRMCELGTKSCVIEHQPTSAADSEDAALTLEQAAQACDQQADGTNGPYRSACLQCADVVRALRDAARNKEAQKG